MTDEKAQRILRQHVRTDQLLGIESVPVAEVEVAQVTSVITTSQTSTSPTRSVVPPRPAPTTPPRPVAPPATLTFAPSTPVAKIDRETKLTILGAMDSNEVKVCTKCNLCRTRTNTVFGEGDVDAKIMFVGEGPGADEDAQGRPFVGKAGELLTDMIVKGMKIPRESVYIANIVKCRPPGNRPPTPEESAACIGYLQRQIDTIQPKVLVTLGATATKGLLKTTMGITAIRGNWHSYPAATVDGQALPAMPTFHPSYILRAYTPENRKMVWEDLKKVLSKSMEGV